MTNVIMERYITATRDMDDIEAAITRELGGENGRCAFLRSQSYLKLRMAALYRDARDRTPCVVYHEGLKVSLDWTDAGKQVTLRSLDCQEYHEEPDPYTVSRDRKTQLLAAL